MTLLGQVAETPRYERTLFRWTAADADVHAGRELTDAELEAVRDALYDSTATEVFGEVVFSVTGSIEDEQRNHKWLPVEMSINWPDGSWTNEHYVRIPASTPETRIEKVATETLLRELEAQGTGVSAVTVGYIPDLADTDSYEDDEPDHSMLKEDLRNAR